MPLPSDRSKLNVSRYPVTHTHQLHATPGPLHHFTVIIVFDTVVTQTRNVNTRKKTIQHYRNWHRSRCWALPGQCARYTLLLSPSFALLSYKIRLAAQMSRKTWSAPWWLPGSVSEFGERIRSLVFPYSRWMRRERWSVIPRYMLIVGNVNMALPERPHYCCTLGSQSPCLMIPLMPLRNDRTLYFVNWISFAGYNNNIVKES